MNLQKTLFAATVTAGLLFSSVVSSASVVVTEIATAPAEYTAPAPLKVVMPVDIPRRYQNEIVRLSLTVDESGRAHNVALLSGHDPVLVKRLLPVIARWEFKPATRAGEPVSADVVLPLQLVDGPTG